MKICEKIALAAAILGVAVELAAIMPAKAADLGGMKDSGRVDTCASCNDTINWIGLSIGIQAGVTAANHDIKASAPGEEGNSSVELDGLGSFGLSGRVYPQFDYQLGDWVVGARVWYGITDAEVKATASFGGDSVSATLEEQDNYGGVVRLGRLLGSEKRALLYGLAGWEHVSYEIKTSPASPGLSTLLDTSPDYQGLVAGIGMEYALTQAVFFSIEYQHAFLGEEDVSKISGLKIGDTLDTDMVHAGLRVKF